MFDALKSAGALAALMKNKEALREAGERVKQKLADMRVDGESGGGAVRITVDGKMRVHSVNLSPALAAHLADPASRAAAESLIADAFNAAAETAQRRVQEEIVREAEALGLSDLPMLKGLIGG